MTFFSDLDWLMFDHIRKYPYAVHIHRPNPPHYYAINYADSGALFFSYGDEPEVRLEAPVAWITWPGPHFRYRPAGKTWDHRFAVFFGPRARGYLQSQLFPNQKQPPWFRPARIETFRSIFDHMLEGLKRGDRDAGVHYLEGLLLELHREVPRAERLLAQLVQKLATEMHHHPAADFDLKQKAAGLGISYSLLRSTFKKEMGEAPHHYLIRARLDRAAELIQGTGAPLAEIMKSSGFSDPFHFSRQFKKRFLLSPTHFREKRAGF